MVDIDAGAFATPRLAQDTYQHRWNFWIAGGVAIVAGVLAIILPVIATLAATLLFGALLTVSGVVECIAAIRSRGAGRIALRLFMGLIAVAAGLVLLFEPLSGAVALTLLLSAYFVAAGLFRMFLAWALRESGSWGWMLASGLLSLALGVLILSGLPGSALWILGLLIGVDLIFYGATLIAIVAAARRVLRRRSGAQA